MRAPHVLGPNREQYEQFFLRVMRVQIIADSECAPPADAGPRLQVPGLLT